MACSQRPWIDMVVTERPAEANLILFTLDGVLLMVSESSNTVEKAFVEGGKEIGWLLEKASHVRRNGGSERAGRVKQRRDKTNLSDSSRLYALRSSRLTMRRGLLRLSIPKIFTYYVWFL